MRPVPGGLLFLFFFFVLELVHARPASGLVRRQDNNPDPSSSSSIPSDPPPPAPTAPPETSQTSFSVSASDSASISSVSSVSSSSSNSTLLVSTVSTPSVTLRPTGTSSLPDPPPEQTENRDANTPAAFFSNRSATLVLGITAGGIACIIVVLVLWINFRRAWYFPWNKRKKRNDPNRWSTYSFREKPHLPLGRKVENTMSTEHLTRDGPPSNDGHSSHGHTDASHGYQGEMDDTVPPLPEIRIDPPRSAQVSTRRSSGPAERSRWSTSDGSASIYSQQTQSIYDDNTGRYTTNNVVSRPVTRVTSTSSIETSPFRFDTIYEEEHDRSQPLTRQRDEEISPLSRLKRDPSKPPQEPFRILLPSQQAIQPSSAPPRMGVTFSATTRESMRARSDGEDNRYQMNLVERGPSPTETFVRMLNPLDSAGPSVGSPTVATPKQPPKGILKSPHYLTTSARLAGRGNMI